MIFTGGAFQLYWSELNPDERYIGLCKNDSWKIIGYDIEDLDAINESNDWLGKFKNFVSGTGYRIFKW